MNPWGNKVMNWGLQNNMFLSSKHYLAGLAYSRNGWLLSFEGFLKQRMNHNEKIFTNNETYTPVNSLWGADVYLKKEWRKQTFFCSYSIENEEYSPVISRTPPKRVGQEIKSGVIVSINSFHFSTTYIYSAGFSSQTTEYWGNDNFPVVDEPYSRFDLSLNYRLQKKNFKIQAGASLLNVFDTNNIKYSYRISDQYNVFNVYVKAAPRTPIVFLEINF